MIDFTEKNDRTETLYNWMYYLVMVITDTYHTNIMGGNAYLYKTLSEWLCCVLLYCKWQGEWTEILATHRFIHFEIPLKYSRKLTDEKHEYLDVSDLLHKSIDDYCILGDEFMKKKKFNLFNVAQTAINVADNVNSTYHITHNENDLLSTYTTNDTMTGGERAWSMARAALNQDWFDLAKLGFDALINLVSEEPLSYENFLAAISQYVDVKIQQFSAEESLYFVGGECTLSVDKGEKKLFSKVQLYFKNSVNKWIVKELNGATGFHCFTAETLDGEITEVMIEGGRKFPVTPPQM